MDIQRHVTHAGFGLTQQGAALRRLKRFARRTPRENLWVAKKIGLQRLEVVRAGLRHLLAARGWEIEHHGCDRTVYVIGLFGSGRQYINRLITAHLGRRAIYFRDCLGWHAAPTSLIYSGHATIKYPSLAQSPPELTRRLLESVRSGFAELIFIYRHPLDSLLTNWVWWRTYLRTGRWLEGISRAYGSNEDLCTDLERNFGEFRAFAAGDPSFYAALSGPRFLSFVEFVEETALFIACATVSLRLEDFMIDPLREFSKIAQVMSADLELNGLAVERPRSQPYRYAAVAQCVPRFQAFIDELDAHARQRIEGMGYALSHKASADLEDVHSGKVAPSRAPPESGHA